MNVKYYEQLARLGVFTKSDVEKLVGKSETADSLLQNYKKRGLIEQVKRNLYVTRSLETGQAIAGRYRIASKIKPQSYITHHSAYEYYGYANQVYYEVYVSAQTKFSEFTFDDVRYRFISPRILDGVVMNPDGVRTTDMERTTLDSINDFERIGGLEELLRCLDAVPSLSESKLASYLGQYSKRFLYQKTGYILGHFQSKFRLSEGFFELCELAKGKSVRYFYNAIRFESPTYDSRWNLFVPQDLMAIISKGVRDTGEIR